MIGRVYNYANQGGKKLDNLSGIAHHLCVDDGSQIATCGLLD